MQGMVPLSGFGGVSYSVVRKAVPRNLLDNSDFRNPVNQRGRTSYSESSTAYTIDRWKKWNKTATISVVSGGITITGKAQQYLERIDPGKVYTAAAMKTDGTLLIYSGMFQPSNDYTKSIYLVDPADEAPYLAIYEDGTYVWAALYEGEYTAETLPEYQPKGYWAELLECKRYYQVVQPTSLFLAQTSSLLFANIRYSTMRSIPSISLGYTKIHLYSDTRGFDAAVNIQESIVYEDGATIGFSTNGAIQGKIYRCTEKVPDFIILTADL